MSAKNFQVNDLVWAKMKGYPHWPGQISSPPPDAKPRKNSSYVFFFGSNNFAWIKNTDIERHSEEMLQKFGTRKDKVFRKAVEEINELSHESPLDDQVSTTSSDEQSTVCHSPPPEFLSYASSRSPSPELSSSTSSRSLSPTLSCSSAAASEIYFSVPVYPGFIYPRPVTPIRPSSPTPTEVIRRITSNEIKQKFLRDNLHLLIPMTHPSQFTIQDIFEGVNLAVDKIQE